jgi:hypothetical protein
MPQLCGGVDLPLEQTAAMLPFDRISNLVSMLGEPE